MTDAVEVLRIDSLEDERLDAYVRLTERELRCVLEPQKGIFIAESAKVIGACGSRRIPAGELSFGRALARPDDAAV